MPKKRIISDTKSLDFYKDYKSKNKTSLSYIEYISVVKDYFFEIINEIIYNNYTYVIPNRLGTIGIYKRKIKKDNSSIKKYPIDFGATNKLWKENPEAKAKKILVRHLNKHTGEYVMFIHYSTKYSNFKNKTVYSFQPARQEFKRKAAKAFKDTTLNLDYYER